MNKYSMVKESMSRGQSYFSVEGKNGNLEIPKTQRALIFQGGGALGAYEVGAFESIYNHLRGQVISEKSLFNIVAGVSAGAINATLLVDYYLKNDHSWNGSPDLLRNIWNKLSAKTLADYVIPSVWGTISFFNPLAAHYEAARRYWSWFEIAALTPPFGGVSPNLSVSMWKPDFKYISPINSGIFYDFSSLEIFLADRIKYPIQTSADNEEPRLLICSVDAVDCSSPIVFDSYQDLGNECRICNAEFRDNKLLLEHFNSNHKDSEQDASIDPSKLYYTVYGSDNETHVIRYDGIGQQELMSSCLFPYSLEHSQFYDHVTKTQRVMWDGAFLNNTPLREVLQHHREFWLNYYRENEVKTQFSKNVEVEDLNSQARPPNLEVYIVNLYPAIEQNNEVPRDKDSIEDRMNDIRFCDRTKYDQKISEVISDYITLSKNLIDLAKKKHATDIEIEQILDLKGKSLKRTKEPRKYRDLLQGRFDVTVHRIDRTDDPYTISGKHADFSELTIEKLIEAGKRDTDDYFEELLKSQSD